MGGVAVDLAVGMPSGQTEESSRGEQTLRRPLIFNFFNKTNGQI
jgi:hypothetical protein